MTCSERSRLQKSSYSVHSFSVISLTAARDRSRPPVSSVNASSMSRVDRPRASRRRSPHLRDEGLRRIANLRRRIFHRPFRRLHLAGPITIAVARLLALAALIARAAKDAAALALESFLDDPAQRQTTQVASTSRRPQLSIHQGAKLLARALRRG